MPYLPSTAIRAGRVASNDWIMGGNPVAATPFASKSVATVPVLPFAAPAVPHWPPLAVPAVPLWLLLVAPAVHQPTALRLGPFVEPFTEAKPTPNIEPTTQPQASDVCCSQGQIVLEPPSVQVMFELDHNSLALYNKKNPPNMVKYHTPPWTNPLSPLHLRGICKMGANVKYSKSAAVPYLPSAAMRAGRVASNDWIMGGNPVAATPVASKSVATVFSLLWWFQLCLLSLFLVPFDSKSVAMVAILPPVAPVMPLRPPPAVPAVPLWPLPMVPAVHQPTAPRLGLSVEPTAEAKPTPTVESAPRLVPYDESTTEANLTPTDG
jgi:hypothetical protein